MINLIAFSEEILQKLWVPEQDFASLSDDEILIRIQNFNEKLDFPTYDNISNETNFLFFLLSRLRALLVEQEWPIMMCIQSLKHKEPLVRENALHVLTRMADYGIFSLLGVRVKPFVLVS